MALIPLTRHMVCEEEAEAAARAIRSPRLIDGPNVAAFERAFAEKVGARYAVATASCTAALEAACIAVGLDDSSDAVTAPLTFIATGGAISRTGAAVRFADIGTDDLQMTPGLAYRACTERTKAIVAVHYGGAPADIEALEDIAWSRKVALIEDAAHCAGAKYLDGTPIGSRPDTIACFSFGPQKVITTGYGGMVVTGRKEWADAIRKIVRQGLERDRAYRRQTVRGFNGAMSEVSAAIGLVQLDRLDGFLESRRRVAETYLNALYASGVEPVWSGTEAPWSIYPVRVRNRNAVIDGLAAEGIETAIHYPPVHLHPTWRRMGIGGQGTHPYAEVASTELLSLPMSACMTDQEVHRVADAVRRLTCPLSMSDPPRAVCAVA